MNTEKIFGYAFLLIVFGVILLAFSMVDISEQINEDNTARSLERQQEQTQSWIESGLEFANEQVYVQDLRTGICFATSRVSGWHGHFTTVDCDMVPPELLNTLE